MPVEYYFSLLLHRITIDMIVLEISFETDYAGICVHILKSNLDYPNRFEPFRDSDSSEKFFLHIRTKRPRFLVVVLSRVRVPIIRVCIGSITYVS